MNWNKITQISELDEINNLSLKNRILVFKHSTRCSISASALNRLERNWNNEIDDLKIIPYFLDLIAFRNISNEIASKWNIEHQSPQVLIIENGICVYNNSHMGISYEEILNR